MSLLQTGAGNKKCLDFAKPYDEDNLKRAFKELNCFVGRNGYKPCIKLNITLLFVVHQSKSLPAPSRVPHQTTTCLSVHDQDGAVSPPKIKLSSPGMSCDSGLQSL